MTVLHNIKDHMAFFPCAIARLQPQTELSNSPYVRAVIFFLQHLNILKYPH